MKVRFEGPVRFLPVYQDSTYKRYSTALVLIIACENFISLTTLVCIL